MMGFNDRMEEVNAYSLNFFNKSICSNCIADDYLAEIIKSNATEKECSYCLSRGNKNIACDYKLVVQKIYDRIFLSYKDAQDTGMPFVEGSWLIDQDYIQDVINDFDPGWHATFIEDLCESADPNLYLVPHVHDDWVGVPESDVLGYGWQTFKEQILYKTRYLFLTQKSAEHDDFYSVPLTSMLDRLGDLSNRLGLIREIPQDSYFYRVRAHEQGQEFTEFEEIGAAPRRLAGAGRMNPAGIPYFYIAFMPDTAKFEVIDDQKYWSLAKLKLLNNIQVLDLTELPPVPSIFDISQHNLREEILFLYEFIEDLLKPVAKDGKEHIDYVPTQVVSEYFRYVFEPKLQGIMYPSVKHSGGVNIAIFESDNDEIKKSFNLEEIVECENTES